MAVRQYIGARYTTKIYENSLDPSSAEWESGRSWEPLILVTYNNSSYLSKKQIPSSVGNPAANPAYWVCTGYYNGQIADLQNQVNAINLALSGEITDRQNGDNSLRSMINRRFVLIGDSYGEGTNLSPQRGWCYYFQQFMNLSSDRCYSFPYGGSGFIGNQPGHTFSDLLDDAYNAVTDPDTITDVIVCGGCNDMNQATLASEVTAFCAKVQTLFPNAITSIGFVGYFSDSDDGARRKMMLTVRERYYLGRGVKSRILPNVEYIIRSDPSFMDGDFHGTSTGYIALAKGIMSAVLGGNGYEDQATKITASTFTAIDSSTRTLYQLFNKDTITVYMGTGINQYDVSGETITANSWFKLGTFTNSLIHGFDAKDTFGAIRTQAIVGFTGATYATIDALVCIYEDELYISFIGVDPSTGVFYDFTNATYITLRGNLTFITDYV